MNEVFTINHLNPKQVEVSHYGDSWIRRYPVFFRNGKLWVSQDDSNYELGCYTLQLYAFKYWRQIPEKKKRFMTPIEVMNFCLDKRPEIKHYNGNWVTFLDVTPNELLSWNASYRLPSGDEGKFVVEE